MILYSKNLLRGCNKVLQNELDQSSNPISGIKLIGHQSSSKMRNQNHLFVTET